MKPQRAKYGLKLTLTADANPQASTQSLGRCRLRSLAQGEFLVTSMDRDGTKNGYDIELTRAISERVNVPVIASGGAGVPKHLYDVFVEGKADAALAASIFHYNQYPVPVVKDYLRKMGVTIRQ